MVDISIAMATYNGARYLEDQLDSFALQTQIPNELVVCDDGSSDETISIVEKFALRAPFEVRLIKNSHNLGFTKNFEKALSLSAGKFVFLSDQDDVWYPNKISTVMNAFGRNPKALLVIHDGELVGADLNSTGATKLGQTRAGGYGDLLLATGALTAVRSKLLQLALPVPNGVVGHDSWIHRLADLLGGRILLDDLLQKIRRHDSNTSSWIVNSIQPINRFSVFRSQLKTAKANSYTDRLIINSSLIDRFSAIADGERGSGPYVPISEIIDNLKSERNAILKRDAILHKGFVARKKAAIEMLVAGEYKHFNGYKSFLRDFCR